MDTNENPFGLPQSPTNLSCVVLDLCGLCLCVKKKQGPDTQGGYQAKSVMQAHLVVRVQACAWLDGSVRWLRPLSCHSLPRV